MRKKEISFIALCIIGFLLSTNLTEVLAWSNGGYSSDPSNPDYGTHDWIAQHALDWLPISEKQYILNNLATYLYGTELPDNVQAPDGIGDSINHHFYYSSAGTVVDDSAADRASAVYTQALNFMMSGDSVNAAKYAGVMSHYIVDLAVFGHVMGSGTDWGAETHHSDYESYVNQRTSTYSAEFNAYLFFDGNLRIISAYDAAKELAYDTTFDVNGDQTCLWMDQNYDWSNPTFRNRCGESLNLAVNYLTDVLHTLYIQNEPATAGHVVINEFDQDPPTDQNYVFDEWVELYNPTESAVNIGGWSVSTTHGWTVTVNIPSATTLQPQAYYIVWHSTGQWLDDTDESIILRNSAGVEIDRTPIKSDAYNDNRAWARYPNGQDIDSDSDWRFQSSTRGYSNGGEPANNSPTAFIDSISPNPATQGQSVSFSGHGVDSDGSIVACNWRSSIDGQLSTSASFSTSSLSVGTHTIYFKVQDDDGAWSTEVTRALTINPASLFHVGSILYLHSERSAEWSGTLDYDAPTLSTGEPVEAELPEYGPRAYLFGIQADFDTTIPAGLYVFNLWIKADNDQRVVISLGCKSETMSINFAGWQYEVKENTEITEYSFDYRLQDAYEIYEGEWFYTQISLGTGLTLYIDHQSTPSSIITPTLSLFHPHTEFWFTWYDKANTEICNIHFVNTGSSEATVAVYIAGSQVDSFALGAGLSTYRNYPVDNGPVHVVGTQPLWVTKRVVGWGGFKEVYGLPSDVASTDIYYTWYDYASPAVTTDRIYLTNPSGSVATAQIYIGGSFIKAITLSAGESKYEVFPGVIDGPVRIMSDLPIFSTQLVIGWSDFDEIVGTPSWYVASEHYFTWYDLAGASIDNIHIINLGASTAHINIYIAGTLKTTTPVTLPSGAQTYVNYPGVIGGPVRIVSDQPIRVTQRIVGWGGFKEVFSVPAELLASSYYFTWYDWASPPVTWDALHFMNPSATQTAHITVRIGGNVMTTLTLAPGQADYATYQGTINGPILVTSDIPIMTTQRILGWSSFEETIGMQWT